MKLLMLTHRFPYPPTRGDTIRAWGELHHLAGRHDVWLACVDRSVPRADDLEVVRSICRDVAVAVRPESRCLLAGALGLLRGGSLTQGYFHDARLYETLTQWSAAVDFDAVLSFSSAMAPYALSVAAKRRVLDMNDVDSGKWRTFAGRAIAPLRWLYTWEAHRLAMAEARWAAAHDLCLLVNERERDKLLSLAEPRATAVVGTGLDLSRYAAIAAAAASAPPCEPVVGMVGSMSYSPNVRAVNWFGERVWPRIRAALPAARWLIVGSRPTRAVRRWSGQPGVTVTGFVEDVRPYLAAMRVVVNAVGEEIGVQTKLIEALAAGKPSVVTPAAAAGLEYGATPPFLIAESDDVFASSVLRLLSDDLLASRLSARARAVAETGYAVERQAEMVERGLAGRTPVRSVATAAADSPALRDSDSPRRESPRPRRVPA